MTNPETRTPLPPPPLWALALGAVASAGCAFLVVWLLKDQVRAFALGEAGAAMRLLLPTAAGQVAAALAVWGVLRVAFGRSWKRRDTQLYVWLGVLLVASVWTSTVAVTQGVNQARKEAIRAAAEIGQREQAAIDRIVARFPDEQDADLTVSVFREMQRWADPITDIREVTVSRDRNGRWEAVCGQVLINGGKWAGFVTRREDGGYLRAALEQDGFDEVKRKTCRPLAQKYLGVEGVDFRAYMAERDALGCTGIDIYYWQSEKAYCHGKVVQPRP